MKKDIHIGRLIEAKIVERGITKAELARRIKVSSQALTPILKKAHINTDQLQKISTALDYDFFQHYVTTSKETVATTNIKSSEALTPMSIAIPIHDPVTQEKILKAAGITIK